MGIYVTAYWESDNIRREWISEAPTRIEHIRKFHQMIKDIDGVRMWTSTKSTTYKGWSSDGNS
ncbi:MAG: hypothetical protein ACO24P_03705 [Candidatus Nanopelagicaceae bacterium]